MIIIFIVREKSKETANLVTFINLYYIILYTSGTKPSLLTRNETIVKIKYFVLNSHKRNCHIETENFPNYFIQATLIAEEQLQTRTTHILDFQDNIRRSQLAQDLIVTYASFTVEKITFLESTHHVLLLKIL